MRRISYAGSTFQPHIDGWPLVPTPGRPVEGQSRLAKDIQIQFEGCMGLPATSEETQAAVDRSLAWAKLCKREFARQLDNGTARPGQALFGIVQGGTDEALRRRSADALVALDLPGYGIGGLAVGEPQQQRLGTLG